LATDGNIVDVSLLTPHIISFILRAYHYLFLLLNITRNEKLELKRKESTSTNQHMISTNNLMKLTVSTILELTCYQWQIYIKKWLF